MVIGKAEATSSKGITLPCHTEMTKMISASNAEKLVTTKGTAELKPALLLNPVKLTTIATKAIKIIKPELLSNPKSIW